MEANADQSQSQTQTQTQTQTKTQKPTKTKTQKPTKEETRKNDYHLSCLANHYKQFQELKKQLDEYANNHYNSCYICCNGGEITNRTCPIKINTISDINRLGSFLEETTTYYMDCSRKNKTESLDIVIAQNVWEKYRFIRDVFYYSERLFQYEMNRELLDVEAIRFFCDLNQKFYDKNIENHIVNQTKVYKDIHFEKFKNPKKIRIIRCMSDFIAKYEMKIKNLIPESHRGEIFEELIHKTYNKNGFQQYKYDKPFNDINTRSYQTKVLKFLAKLFYSSINVNYKKTAWALWYLLELSTIKTPIFYFGENPEKTRTYSISLIYNWVDNAIQLRKTEKKSYEKTTDKIDSYKCDIFGCDKVEEYREFIKNCNCSFNVCVDCYCNLSNPKCCPQCRRKDYSMSFDRVFDKCEYKFHIKYNNQEFLYSECKNNLNNGDFFFPCLKLTTKEIVKSKITLESDDDIVKYFIDGTLSETLEYMDRDFVVDFFKDNYPEKYFFLNLNSLSSVIQDETTTGDGMMDFLGLTNMEKFDERDNMIGNYKITFDFAKKYYLQYGYDGVNREREFLSEMNIKINKRNEIFSVFVGEEIMNNYFNEQYFD